MLSQVFAGRQYILAGFVSSDEVFSISRGGYQSNYIVKRLGIVN